MVNHICGGSIKSVKTTKDKKHHIKYQYDKDKITSTLNLLEYRKSVDEYLHEYKVKDYLNTDVKYTPTMKAFKKPLTSHQKQLKADKEIIAWMRPFKSGLFD